MPGAAESLPGMKMLGVLIGDPEFVRDAMETLVTEKTAILSTLERLPDAQSQGLLLRFCANPRMVHWLRGVAPDQIAEAAATHDSAILASWQRGTLPGPPLHETALRLAALPNLMGGVGLTSASRVSSAAWLGSWAQAWATICRLFPIIPADMMTEEPPVSHHVIGSVITAWGQVREAAEFVEAAREVGRSLPQGVPSFQALPAPSEFIRVQKRAQRLYASALHSRAWLELHESLPIQERAWLHSVSCDSLGTQFLRAIPKHPIFAFTSEQYQCAVRHLLKAPQPVVGAVITCGGCGEAVDAEGLHYISCAGGHSWFTAVHNAVEVVVCQMLRSVYPSGRVVMEDRQGARVYSPHHCPDVTVFDHDGRGYHLLVDPRILRPLTSRYVHLAGETPGAAAARVELDKVRVYGNVGQHRVVPFVLEEWGLMGPMTRRFFGDCLRVRRDRLEVEGRYATWSARTWSSFWRQRLSVTLAKVLADCIIRRAQADYRIS
jgi:hypothetical protein